MYFFFSIFHQGTSIQGINSGKYSTLQKEQIIIIRGTIIELIGTRLKTGKLTTLSYANLFQFNISIISFRFKNKGKECFSLLDNQGNVGLFFINNFQKFILSSSKNIGNNNLKENIYPFLAALNKNNFIYMICAIEKLKFSFFIGKNRFKRPVFFKSRMEVKHSSVICYHITSFETKTRNGFLTIETCYSRPYDKFLVFYEIKFEYNIIKRKIIAKINSTSYLVIPLGNFTNSNFLMVFSESLLTMVDVENKKFITKNIPFRKTKSKSSQTFISSYGVFCGKFKIFLMIANQSGDLLKIYFNRPIHSIKNHCEIFIDYFDTVFGKIRFLTLLKNGHLFASMDSGNHFYFQFLTLGKKKRENQTFFYPRLNFQNLKIIDELASVSPVLSFDRLFASRQIISELILMSGTSSNSSVRLLQESCNISLLGIKRFKFLPIGINVVEKEFDFKCLVISFSNFSQSFFINKNLEEINGEGFIYDDSTFSIEKINNRNGILQFTLHKIRLICFRKKKKKIIEWGPLGGSVIVDSTIFKINNLHIFVILSSGKGILIKITKDEIFIELENVDLRHKIFSSVFGTSYLPQNFEKWDLIILFSKKEKSLRLFSINKTNFMKLTGVHILPWTPETAKFFLKGIKLVLLISLNNGMVIEAEFNSKTGQISQTTVKILSFSPLYFSKNFFESKSLIFGSKIWTLNNNLFNKNVVKCIYNGQVDLAEALGNSLFLCKDYSLKILIKKKNNYFFSKFIKIRFPFTPGDFCNSNFYGIFPVIAVAFRENYSGICDHQMNLSVKETILLNRMKFFKFSDHSWTSGICLVQFNPPCGMIEKNIIDTIIIRGSNGKKSISTIFSKNFFDLNKNTIIASMTNCEKNFSTVRPMFLIRENRAISSSLGVFSFKSSYIYYSQKGGRHTIEKKITFLFEFFFPIFSIGNFKCFLGKVLFGQRFLCCLGKIVMVCEIKKNSIKVIYTLTSAAHILSSVDVSGNRLIATDEIQGLKLFKFIKKKPFSNLISEKKNINWIIGSKMFDPVSFLIWDKIGRISFFRRELNIGILDKFFSKNSESMDHFFLTQFKTNYIFINLFCLINNNANKNHLFFFANCDGTLGLIIMLFKHHIIFSLKKIFLNLQQIKKGKNKTTIRYLKKNSNIIDANIINLLKILK